MLRRTALPHRVALPRPALLSALPDELVRSFLGHLLVAELATSCVNRRFRVLFHNPALWLAHVETLLPVCTPNARREVQRVLEGRSHLWNEKLCHDHAWHTRLEEAGVSCPASTS
jgi:hypothetical protein